MPSGIVACRLYLVAAGGGFENAELVAEVAPASPVTVDGLPSETGYDIYATNVDAAGNESDPSEPLSTATLGYPESGDSLSSEDIAVVDQIVADAMADGMGPGVLLSITGPRGAYTQAYGVASLDEGARPISVDDHMRLGSATKTFTAAAAMLCVDQGLMSLDDTLDMFDTLEYQVSEVPYSDRITVRHMLMQRSGIYDYMTDLGVQVKFFLFPNTRFDQGAALNTIVGGTPIAEPGAGFHYTNGNIVLLGLCVRAATGREIRDVILEDIVAPLGLTETSFPTTNAMPEPYADGYGGGGKAATAKTTGFNVPGLAGCAGGMVSTIHDLQAWGQAMRDGSLLSPESLELFETLYCPIPLETPFAPNIANAQYGLARDSMGLWHGHGGSMPGYECSIQYEPTSGAVIAVMENSQSMGSDGVAVAAWTRVHAAISEYLYPGTNITPDFPSCGDTPAPTPPAITGTGSTGTSVPAAFAFSAPEGADVWVAVTTDRATTISGATYGGSAMTEVAAVNHRGSDAYGTTKVYHLAEAGDGTEKDVSATGSGGGNWITQAVHLTGTAGTPVVVNGAGDSPSQTITGHGLHILGARARGVDLLGGAKIRSTIVSGAATQVISTTTYPTTFRAVFTQGSGWGAVFIPVES